jgi:hypothetical protein
MSGEDGQRGRITRAPAYYDLRIRRGHIYTHGSSSFGEYELTRLLVSSGIGEFLGVIEMDFNSSSIKN